MKMTKTTTIAALIIFLFAGLFGNVGAAQAGPGTIENRKVFNGARARLLGIVDPVSAFMGSGKGTAKTFKVNGKKQNRGKVKFTRKRGGKRWYVRYIGNAELHTCRCLKVKAVINQEDNFKYWLQYRQWELPSGYYWD